MLGLLEDVDDRMVSAFASEGDKVLLLGDTADELGGSEYLKVIHDKIAGASPAIDWPAEKALIECLTDAASAHLLISAHDLSEGGLAVALAESCLQGGIGAAVEIPAELAPVTTLFSETQARALVSVAPDKLDEFTAMTRQKGVPVHALGTVGGDSLSVEGVCVLPLEEMRDVYENALEKMIAGAHH